MTMDTAEPFELKSVVHLVRPDGARARDLESLRVGLERASAESLFYHAIQCPLRRPDSSELPPDDLSAWVNGVLQDRETAERLSYAAQSHAGSEAELRQALVAVLGEMSEKDRHARGAPEESAFVFLAAESVLVPVGLAPRDADELVEALAGSDPGVWFYHLIEEPWYLSGTLPAAVWARGLGASRLGDLLEEAAHSGHGLVELRSRLLRRWRQIQLRRRVTEAAEATESERREAGHAAVVGLVRRILQTEGSDDASRGA